MSSGQRRAQRAVIWDLDGVIVDTTRFHFAAWQQWARELGRTFTAEDFARLYGVRNSDIVSRFLGPDISAEEVEALGERKEKILQELIGGNIEPLPGALPLLRSLKQRGWRLALASSGPLDTIELTLSPLGIGQTFDCLVSARGLSRGKPAPDIFLLAASKLGVTPERCVVIEDTIDGVSAAKSAAMKCIAVTNTYPRERLTAADLIVDSLEAVAVEDIERLLETRNSAGGVEHIRAEEGRW